MLDQRRRKTFDRSQLVCHWCRQVIGNACPYRSMIDGIAGARWLVCGPECEMRPEGRQVFATWNGRR